MTTTKTKTRPIKRRSSSSAPTPRLGPAAVSPPPLGKFIDLGSATADWIERNLVHGEGDVYGERLVLEAFQRWMLRRLYLVDATSLRRIVRRALFVGPQGWAKTELIAAVGLAELAGPTTVDERGRPALRRSPNIPIAAASFEQTDRLFGAAQIMARHEDSGIAPFVEAGEREITLKDRPGKLYRVAAVAGTNEGGLPTAFCADELHEWSLPKQGRLHLVLGNKLAKRDQGLELNITTPDDAHPDSLLGKLVAYGERVASGEIVDQSFLYVRYAAQETWDLADPAQLRSAIREASPASWLNVEAAAARYEVDHVPDHEVRRYLLGQFVRPKGSWLPEAKWGERADPRAVPEGTKIVLGFDGSYSRDSTGLVGCTLDGYLFVIDAWEKPEHEDGWIVPRHEVDARVAETFDRFKVLELACDPHRWTNEIGEWADRYGEVVVEFPTSAPKRIVPACARFYGAVVSGEQISHDGDPRLSRHLHNAVVKETRDGAYITKENRNSLRKIDLAEAAVMAYDRAMWHRDHRPSKAVALVIGGE